MKPPAPSRRLAGFSLIELVSVLLILGLLVATSYTVLRDDAMRAEDRINAQAIVFACTTGKAAKVKWPDGNVAAVVSAVIEGRTPASGPFAGRVFQAKIPAHQVHRAFRHLRQLPSGELVFDPLGEQNPDGQ